MMVGTVTKTTADSTSIARRVSGVAGAADRAGAGSKRLVGSASAVGLLLFGNMTAAVSQRSATCHLANSRTNRARVSGMPRFLELCDSVQLRRGLELPAHPERPSRSTWTCGRESFAL